MQTKIILFMLNSVLTGCLLATDPKVTKALAKLDASIHHCPSRAKKTSQDPHLVDQEMSTLIARLAAQDQRAYLSQLKKARRAK